MTTREAHVMLKSLWQQLRGRRGQSARAAVAARETYHGFTVLAMPRAEGATWRIAGEIHREGADGPHVYTFVRVDTASDHDAAVQLSLRKARQLVDENGDRLFSPR